MAKKKKTDDTSSVTSGLTKGSSKTTTTAATVGTEQSYDVPRNMGGVSEREGGSVPEEDQHDGECLLHICYVVDDML